MRAPASIAASLFAFMSLAVVGCDDTILDPMMNDLKYKPYEANAFFADGRAMREPPAGTVPRERTIGNAALMLGREQYVENAPYVKTFPLPVTSKLLAEGKKRYDITCATCHGILGDGDSLVAGKMALNRPPSLHLRTEPGYYFDVANKGHGIMANYAAELTLEQRWGVVAYIMALQLSQKANVADLPAAMKTMLDKEHP